MFSHMKRLIKLFYLLMSVSLLLKQKDYRRILRKSPLTRMLVSLVSLIS